MMRTLRYLSRLFGAFLVRFKGILFIGVGLGILLFLILRFIVPSLFTREIEKIGLTGRYRVDTLPSFILEMVGDGLTHVSESGKVEPNLATSWSSDDGKTWTFELREDALWQDGKKVVSADVNYDFLDTIVEKPDDKTIIFMLQNAFSPFASVVSKPTFRQGLLGTGEWKVENLRLVGSFVEELILVNSKKDKKIFRFYPTEETAKLGFKLGKVDTLINLFNSQPFDDWKVTNVSKELNPNRVVAIFFNTQDKLLGEKSFRQALAYAIQKDSFEGLRAISPLSSNSWVYNAQVKPYDYEADRAKELIKELPKELEENLALKLVTTPVLLSVAEKVASDWKTLGVETSVQVSSNIPIEFQAFLAIIDIPSDPDQYSLWHSTQTGTNISRYQNPRIDKLLEDGRLELNSEERRKIYLDFQRFLVEDSPAIFLYNPVSYTIRRK